MFKDESYKISSSDPKIIKIGSWATKRIDVVKATWACCDGFISGLRIGPCSVGLMCWTLLGLLIDIFATGWARLLIESLVTKRIEVVKATWACCDGFISSLRIGTRSVGLMQNAKAAFMFCVLLTSFPICDIAFALYPSHFVGA